MPGKTFTCRVITPEGVHLEKQAVSVQFPAQDGLVGVLANHAPMISLVGSGGLALQDDHDQIFYVEMTGGFAEVRDNVLTILADKALPPVQRAAEVGAGAKTLQEAREELAAQSRAQSSPPAAQGK